MEGVANSVIWIFSVFDRLIVISGHGKFETLGALGISSMLLATAGGIAWHALDLLLVQLLSPLFAVIIIQIKNGSNFQL